jgi:hypothetical protein
VPIGYALMALLVAIRLIVIWRRASGGAGNSDTSH